MYCCVGTLALSGYLYRVDADRLGWWLCERQLPSGGLNGWLVTSNYLLLNFIALGRPEKLPDVCYSWWVLASLKMIGRLHWISKVSCSIILHELTSHIRGLWFLFAGKTHRIHFSLSRFRNWGFFRSSWRLG